MRTVSRAIGVFALTATVVGAVLVALNPHTARACTCLPSTGDVDDVAVAFVGRPVAEDYADVGPRVVTEFEVDWVYKGNVGPRVEVHSSTTTCGIVFGGYEDWRDENRYQQRSSIAAWESADGRLGHGICDPWGRIGSFEEAFGPGYPPEGSVDPQDQDDGSISGGESVAAQAGNAPGNSPDPIDSDRVNTTAERAPSDTSPQRAAPGASVDIETTSPNSTDEEPTQIGVLSGTLLLAVAATLAIWLLVARRRARRSSPPT